MLALPIITHRYRRTVRFSNGSCIQVCVSTDSAVPPSDVEMAAEIRELIEDHPCMLGLYATCLGEWKRAA